MAALYKLKSPEEWAKDSLERAGYDVTHVQRTFLPKDTEVAELYAEALYLDGKGKPRTAYIEPPRRIVFTRPGW